VDGRHAATVPAATPAGGVVVSHSPLPPHSQRLCFTKDEQDLPTQPNDQPEEVD
jgi:hypothetical protein